MKSIIALPKQKNLKAAALNYLREAGFIFNARTNCLTSSGDWCCSSLQVIFENAATSGLLLECGGIQAAFMDVARVSSDVSSSVVLETSILVDNCGISLAVPRSHIDCYATDITRLDGLKIATSYPSLLQTWLKADDVRPRDILVLDDEVDMPIVRMSSDAILDIWDADSLRELGLESLVEMGAPLIGLYTASTASKNIKTMISRFLPVPELEITV
ncbi:MAG: hypothetical protein JNL76_03100 [Alphaproteobacteria bacterium]|nr:hypothetical protein [Alphaproteobacteria bacterium]